MDYVDRTIVTFPGHEGVSQEINAKYLFLRQVSEFGPVSPIKDVISRRSLQVERWFFDNNPTIPYADRMNTTFPGQEGVSHEILAKCLIFDDISDLAISGATATVFVSAFAFLCKLVFVDHTPRSLMTKEGWLSWRMRGDMQFDAIARGMMVEWEGKSRLASSGLGLDSGLSIIGNTLRTSYVRRRNR